MRLEFIFIIFLLSLYFFTGCCERNNEPYLFDGKAVLFFLQIDNNAVNFTITLSFLATANFTNYKKDATY